MRSDILYGIAVADAIGNPLEFLSKVTKDDFRRSASAPVLRVSDDTQMSMFLYEALVTSKLSLIGNANDTFRDAYVRWFQTQTYNPGDRSSAGLLGFPCMYHVEAPGRTCMASCRSLLGGRDVVNDSKGNGTVMRCAPIAMLGHALDWSLPNQVALARLDALTTHKHAFAGDSSVLLVVIYHFLLRGSSFEEAIDLACTEVEEIIHPTVLNMVLCMLDPKYFNKRMALFGGWVAEEALAMAVGSVFHSDSYEDAISRAICIKGDSDTVGGIAGGLAVAAGMPAPPVWVRKLNVKSALEYLFQE